MAQTVWEAVEAAFEPEALLRQLRDLGEIGADPEGGRTRLALTDADKAGRDQIVAWMRELDLGVTIDAIGNIFGLLPGEAGGPLLMIGSHIDTVARAGAYDGVYGVLSGLAVARAFRKAGVAPPVPLVIAAFTNEEGVRFQPDMLGSLVHAGGMDLEQALNTVGIDGARLGDELTRLGYSGPIQPGALKPGVYFELHVEQGPVLDHEGFQIGVVEGVQGISWQEIIIEGTANHAGTTPMALRCDAGLTAARVITRLREMTRDSGGTLAAVGSMRFEPNLINVIPSRAIFTVDLRDPDEDRLTAAEETLDGFLQAMAVSDGVGVMSRRLARFQPVPFDPGMIHRVEESARSLGCTSRRIVSGAGHDAQMMARLCPVGMIFVPSKSGLSHCPEEDTDAESLALGVRVLLRAALSCMEEKAGII